MRKGRKPIEECIDCESDNIEVIELLGVYVDDVSKKIFIKYLYYCHDCDYEFIGIKEYDVKYKNFHKERKGRDCE